MGGVRILFAVAIIQVTAMADDQATLASTNSLVAPDARFGLFDGLDHRSAYNQEFFPQPLLVDDTGLEQDGELEFNSLNTCARAACNSPASSKRPAAFITTATGTPATTSRSCSIKDLYLGLDR